MLKKLLLFFTLIVFLLPFKAFAEDSSTERIISFDSDITINQDSSISVKETIKYYFPAAKHGIFRPIPYRYKDSRNNQNFTTPVEILSVKKPDGSSWAYTKKDDGNSITLQIGYPDKTVQGNQTYIISYTVGGVINYFDDHDELYWNVTGNDWEVPISKVTALVGLPDGIDYTKLQLACYTGSTGSKEQNCTKTYKTGLARFSTENGPLTIVVGFNKGVVTQVARAYEQPSDFDKIWNKIHHESAWYLLIIPLALILLLIRYFRSGKDPFGRGTIAPEFEPPDNLLPAEMGTLIDEKADNSDISATIIDIAVRGFLKIREEKKEILGGKKFTLIKLKEADKNLVDFEKKILDGLFGTDKEVKLDKVYETFSEKAKEIKTDLYQSLIKKKYFLKDPNKSRMNYFWHGCILMVIAPMLFIFSVILSFSIFIAGIMAMGFIRSAPKKTREGVIIKEKSLGFKEFLYRAERYRIHWQEKEQIFEKYLSYAMIFGIAEVWAKNFKDINKEPPDWYEGNWTTFNAVYLATSLSSFNSVASTSYSPPSTSASSGGSGFGGGGSSGGGFGGGGGESW